MTDRDVGWRWRSVAASIASVLVLGLVACEDDNGEPPDSGLPSKSESTTEPTTPETPLPTTQSPTKTSTPEAPEIPEAATKPGRAGAKAFVEFYVELENYTRHTGDVAPLRRYSHPKCGGCNHFARYYRDLYEAGGWIKRSDRTIASFDRTVPAADPHDMYVKIGGRTERGTFRRSDEAPVRSGPGQTYTLLVWLLRDPQGWRVSRLDTSS